MNTYIKTLIIAVNCMLFGPLYTMEAPPVAYDTVTLISIEDKSEPPRQFKIPRQLADKEGTLKKMMSMASSNEYGTEINESVNTLELLTPLLNRIYGAPQKGLELFAVAENYGFQPVDESDKNPPSLCYGGISRDTTAFKPSSASFKILNTDLALSNLSQAPLTNKVSLLKSAHRLDFDTAAAYMLYRLRLPMGNQPYSIATNKGVVSKSPLKESAKNVYWNDVENELGIEKGIIKNILKQQNATERLNTFNYTYPELKKMGVAPLLVATASGDDTVKLWNPLTGAFIRTLKEDGKNTTHDNWVSSVAFNPDGNLIATGSYDNTVKLWDPLAGAFIRTLKKDDKNTAHDRSVNSVAFSPDGNFIATASDDATVKLWNPLTGSYMRTLKEDGKATTHDRSVRVRSVAFSPDGNFIATASADNKVKLWNTSTGNFIRTLKKDGKDTTHDSSVYSVAFSPDGKLIATASVDNKVKLWNALTGDFIRTLKEDGKTTTHDNSVWSVAFSPDGNFIATASVDNKVKLWNALTGDFIRILKEDGKITTHDSIVLSVAFSPDGKLIATASGDYKAKLWNALTGDFIRILQEEGKDTTHYVWVNSVAFSP